MVAITLHLWNLGGQERHKLLLKNYAMAALGVIVVFDLSNKESFYTSDLEEMIKSTKENCDAEYILVGNKTDLITPEKSEIQREDIQRLQDKFDISEFIAISVKTGENIESMFEILVELIMSKKMDMSEVDISSDKRLLFKMLIIGLGGVGKNSLIKKYVEGKFLAESFYTIGAGYFTKTIQYEPKKDIERKVRKKIKEIPAEIIEEELEKDKEEISSRITDIRRTEEPKLTPIVTEEPKLTPTVSRPSIQKVYFSVYTPTSISPGTSFVLNVWAYIVKQKSKMHAQASMKGAYKETIQKGPIPTKLGDIFQIMLVLPPPFKVINELDMITWLGEITNATFPVSVPEDIAIGIHIGQVKIFIKGIQVLRIDFTLEIGVSKAQMVDATKKTKRINSAFASYTRKDQHEVLQTIQGIQALGIDVFLDNLSIRQGDYWEKEIYKNILNSDLFLLFWSRAAMNSEWVEKEWTYALDNRGLDFVQPIPLEDPSVAPPPERLASKHFYDLTRIYMSSINR